MPSSITSAQRIDSHNSWPKKVGFAAELDFQQRIADAAGAAPFKTADLNDAGTAEFHRYLGNLIDGLDALPQRPDYTFDHCFRIIDSAAKQLTGKTKTTYAINEVYLNLFSTDPGTWSDIVEHLAFNIPMASAEYIARRLLDASIGKGTDPHAIASRAKKCLDSQRYAEITDKYSYGNFPGAPGAAVNACATFLRLLLATKRTSPLPKSKKSANAATYPALDLTVAANTLTSEEKLRLLLSLFLFVMRNERQHGSAVSPFRTSKATLERYASYYYALYCAYAFALGVISARDATTIQALTIFENVQVNISAFKKFFGTKAK
jgi:hypothetical protein